MQQKRQTNQSHKVSECRRDVSTSSLALCLPHNDVGTRYSEVMEYTKLTCYNYNNTSSATNYCQAVHSRSTRKISSFVFRKK